MKSPVITKKVSASTWVAYFIKDKSIRATGDSQIKAFKKLIKNNENTHTRQIPRRHRHFFHP